MKAKEFNELLEKYKANPQELIRLHCNLKIYLSSYQFDKVVRLRDGKRLNYENNIKNADSDNSSRWLHRVWARIKNAVRFETLSQRVRLYLAKWR